MAIGMLYVVIGTLEEERYFGRWRVEQKEHDGRWQPTYGAVEIEFGRGRESTYSFGVLFSELEHRLDVRHFPMQFEVRYIGGDPEAQRHYEGGPIRGTIDGRATPSCDATTILVSHHLQCLRRTLTEGPCWCDCVE
jgi:hypothetical protein